MRQELFLAGLLLSSFILPPSSFAGALPTFEDFRRIDRTRRLTGQLQTAELLDVMRIDADAVTRVALETGTNDLKLVWGAAELMPDWPRKRALFDAVMRAGLSNDTVVIRAAAAAARNNEFELSRQWIRPARRPESSNVVPWLLELWMLREEHRTSASLDVPGWTTDYRDYGAEAARERVRVLEAVGYTPYSARRLGFMPDAYAVNAARDLGQPPINTNATPVLLRAGRAMQQRPAFLLVELAGQTLERGVLSARPDADSSPEVRYRNAEIEQRRGELKALLQDMESNVIDLATEAEMIRYFDDVLTLGEEAAMRRLADSVRKSPSR